MNLFSSKKSIYLKIINGIFLIWLIVAFIACYSIVISLVLPEPTQSYNDYKGVSCVSYPEVKDTVEPSFNCKAQYKSYTDSIKNSNYYKKNNLLIAIGNIIIVGGTMWFLNKKKED